MQVIRFEVDFAIDNEIIDSDDLRLRLIGLIQEQICDKTIIGNVVSSRFLYNNGEVKSQPTCPTSTIWHEPYPISRPISETPYKTKRTEVLYDDSEVKDAKVKSPITYPNC